MNWVAAVQQKAAGGQQQRCGEAPADSSIWRGLHVAVAVTVVVSIKGGLQGNVGGGHPGLICTSLCLGFFYAHPRVLSPPSHLCFRPSVGPGRVLVQISNWVYSTVSCCFQFQEQQPGPQTYVMVIYGQSYMQRQRHW